MRLTYTFRAVLAGLLLLGAYVAPAQAQDKSAMKQAAQSRMATQAPFHPELQVLDINNFTVWVRNNAKFDWVDPWTAENGSFPKRQGWTVFAQGMVWGGKVQDGQSPELRVNGSTYASGMRPGQVLWNPDTGEVTGPATYDPARHHTWRVRRDLTPATESDAALSLGRSAASYYLAESQGDIDDATATDFVDQYLYDWNNWPADLGAPYEDVNGNGQYDPGVDVPGYPGADQTMWLVTNDLGGISEEAYGSPAIGIEQQTTVWGYNFPSTSPLGNMYFQRSRLIYTGTPDTPDDARIDSMFIVQWADPDVGTYTDDFAGTDTTLSLGFAYSANSTDAGFQNFGLAPAAVGWDFLQGPVNAEGDTLGMTAFVYFAAGSDITDPTLGSYTGTQEWYNLMRGVRPQPPYPATTPFINPVTGEETVFTLAGDPVTRSGSVDGVVLPPGDRRIVLSTGPIEMQKGDTVDVVVGVISGLGQSNLSSVTVMKFYDEFAQFAYDNDFELPSPAPVPPVEGSGLDEQIVLNWSFDEQALNATENYRNSGFRFEGYNVYQLPSAGSSISEGERIATFDKSNFISVVQDRVIDEETGFVVERPVITSTDEGLQRFLRITRDEIRNRPIANGVQYHYAVTAYSVLADDDVNAPFRYLESNPVTLTVTPAPPAPGETVPPEPESNVELAHQGSSTGAVQVQVVDPTRLQDANYELNFSYYDPSTGETVDQLAAGDTLTTEDVQGLFEAEEWTDANALGVGDSWPLRWALMRGGTNVSGWQPQVDPGGAIPARAAPVFEGVKVYVPLVIPQIAAWDWTGDRWVTGVNFGLGSFFGGADLGHNVFGSTLPLSDLQRVELEFQDQADVDANGFASEGAVYNRADGGYLGTGELPFAAYAVDSEGNRRQVNVSFQELSETCSNMIWDMALLNPEVDGVDCTDGGLGGREYLWIHNTDYNGGADYNADNPGQVADVMYFIGPAPRGDNPWLRSAFDMYFDPAIGYSVNEAYSFDVDPAQTGVDSLLTQGIEDINVFPNPYRGFSRLEQSRYDKFMTFTHLPETATIRIFTISGIMVRVLNHDNPNSQFEQWDLNNEDGIPVASGIYIAHVDTPHGEKILKLAIVQEEQILQNY